MEVRDARKVFDPVHTDTFKWSYLLAPMTDSYATCMPELSLPSMQQTLLEYQAILENASVGILFTRDRKVLHCNPKFSEIFGWPHGELVGQPGFVFYLSPENYAEMGRIATPILASAELLDVEIPMCRKDGSIVFCHMRARAINPNNTAEGTIWIAEDISDKKTAQQALAEAHQELELRVQERTSELVKARQQLEVVIQSAPLSIYTRGLDSLTMSWNPAAERMFGWTKEEAIGEPLRTIPKDHESAFNKLHQRAVSGESIIQQDVVLQKRDGMLIDTSVTIAPLKDSEGILYGFVNIIADITERNAAKQKIEFLAYHDPLTGLPNRLLLQDRMQQAIAQADRQQKGLALMFLDLDNFKKINDSLGHATGDSFLKEVATRLKKCVRDTDTISRQGGDEFVIILGDLSGNDVTPPIMSKIMERLQDPFHTEGIELSTSVSIGVALYPDDGSDFETLSKKADMAMFRAKEAGRNTYRFFDEEMNTAATEHLVVRNGLRRALDRGEFMLHYQPQIDLASGTVIGAEALIRWNHPEFGLVPPGRFIPIAEDSGLIVPIGEWVIHEACRQAMEWKKAGLPELVLAVNLSAVQFKRSNVEHTVIQALSQSGLNPHFLELELTESILIQNVEQVLATVKRLKLLGLKISIDDFGTGYSSLSYLKRFDIDKLKIDQSFVRDLATDPDDGAIVRAIIQMARSLNLKTIAEGVETPAMLQQLSTFGCDEAQGYHFARPMPAAEFVRYLSGKDSKQSKG